MFEHLIFEDYVLTPVKNAFNENRSWWLSKRGCTLAMYCFSTSGSEQFQKAELEFQTENIEGYINAFKKRYEEKEC